MLIFQAIWTCFERVQTGPDLYLEALLLLRSAVTIQLTLLVLGAEL